MQRILRGLMGLLGLTVAVVGGYQTLCDGPALVWCDARALLGFACAPPDEASLLERIAFLEGLGDLDAGQRALLDGLKATLREDTLRQLQNEARRPGIEVDAQAEADAIARWRRLGALTYEVDTAHARDAYARALGSTAPWDTIFLARLHVRAGDLGAALSTIEAAHTDLDPTDERTRGVLQNEIGNVRTAQGHLTGALRASEDDLDIAQNLARRDPDNTTWQRDLIVSHVKLGQVAEGTADGAGAARAYGTALAIAERMASAGTLAPVDAWMPDELRALLARLKDN